MNIIILGPQMSGKGTQADLLEHKFGFTHVETGKILRNIAKSNDPKAAQIAEMQKNGILVSSDILKEVLSDTLKNKPSYGFLFDGTPRTFDQYGVIKEELQKYNEKIDKVIFINISEQEIHRRISGRRICGLCGKTYNLATGPFPIGNKCTCGGELIIRTDDTPVATKNRLQYFMNEVLPLIEEFKKEGILLDVNGEQEIEKIHQEILEKLKI